jgi:hypothetical protein
MHPFDREKSLLISTTDRKIGRRVGLAHINFRNTFVLFRDFETKRPAERDEVEVD